MFVVAWLSLGAKMHTASAITLDMLAMLKRLFRTYTRIYIYVYIYRERETAIKKERERCNDATARIWWNWKTAAVCANAWFC